MTHDHVETAARAAYEADCAIGGLRTSDDGFTAEATRWRNVARAVLDTPRSDWPLRARVWTRTSTEPPEKVLEIEGVIDDTYMSCRHVQSMAVPDSDVPGLPEHYEDAELPVTCSTYARGVYERFGIDGLRREAARLTHKMDTARSLLRDSPLKTLLATDGIAGRIERAALRGDAGAIALEVDALVAVVVQAQRSADPCGKVSLVLHVDEDKWTAYEGYAQYLEALTPRD